MEENPNARVVPAQGLFNLLHMFSTLAPAVQDSGQAAKAVDSEIEARANLL
jgi:hypothetical protein